MVTLFRSYFLRFRSATLFLTKQFFIIFTFAEVFFLYRAHFFNIYDAFWWLRSRSHFSWSRFWGTLFYSHDRTFWSLLWALSNFSRELYFINKALLFFDQPHFHSTPLKTSKSKTNITLFLLKSRYFQKIYIVLTLSIKINPTPTLNSITPLQQI